MMNARSYLVLLGVLASGPVVSAFAHAATQEVALHCGGVFDAHSENVLGVDDRGVIEVGKRADITAVPGNPVEDIQSVMDVRFVMKNGRIYRQ